jgi:hypothetical protein
MFKAIDVWKRVDERTAVRYRCYQSLETLRYSVQSADFYRLPLDETQATGLCSQSIELFIEQAPDQRSSAFDTIEQAIAAHDRSFADS